MVQVGIPRAAVEAKMLQEGLYPAVLDCDPDKPLLKKHMKKTLAEELEAFTDGPPLNEDPVYGRFFKVGWPGTLCVNVYM
jgi:hypothetical protein